MTIHRLSETIINQIAAGEVVERPASVVKELIENAIDAGATYIEVSTAGGGKALIRVSDNGPGIRTDELILAVSRHCTSKLENNIHDVRALGFRGEALPSIGSVSRLRLLSRTINASTGAEIFVSGGKIDGPRPSAGNCGTVVEVRDLFYAIPARLKFMKSDKAETKAIIDIVRRIAIAFPHIHFTLSELNRSLSELSAIGDNPEAYIARIVQILGKEFSKNTISLDVKRENIRLTGFAGIPSYNRANSLQQFFYVNGRLIRDRMMTSAIRAAYEDSIARDRYGIVALFIQADPFDVDVNVHPAKTNVRFRDPKLVRRLIISGVREALAGASRSARTGTAIMLSACQVQKRPSTSHFESIHHHYYVEEHAMPILQKISTPSADLSIEMAKSMDSLPTYPLGAARAQIHQNYIISQTKDSLIIVDQHAAHERLVYEALKQALYTKPLPSQMLLVPEIVNFPEEEAERLLNHAKTLRKFGLVIESFGPGAVVVRETPAMLGEVNALKLVHDLADEIAAHETANGLKAMLDYVAATMACHSSIRSGRLLKAEEMNALLRQMEKIPVSGTCNHGRPTYIELKLVDIERFFERR